MTTVACDSASPLSLRNAHRHAHILMNACVGGRDKEREVMEEEEEVKEVMKPGEHLKIP